MPTSSKENTIWFIFGFAIFILVICYVYEVSSEEIAQEEIVKDVRGLISDCRDAGSNVRIRGKILVWDIRGNKPSGAYTKLPRSLRAESTDKLITVFMVIGKRNEQVGTYSISNQPAYRQYLDIAVAYWPERKPAGFLSVVSAEPPSSRMVKSSPEYGDPNERIARRIESLLH